MANEFVFAASLYLPCNHKDSRQIYRGASIELATAGAGLVKSYPRPTRAVMTEIPSRASEVLNHGERVCEIAETRDVLYLRRGSTFPLAMEDALKLKEICYIHVGGYAAGGFCCYLQLENSQALRVETIALRYYY